VCSSDLIIDDTYNSSPEAALLAVETLAKLPLLGRKIAVLGDMLELGAFSQEGHRLLGSRIRSKDVDILVTVGERARDIAQAAEDGGFSRDLIWRFDRGEEAGRFIQNQIVSGDIILVKASQGIRLEKVVKELMAEPNRAPELLVRQGLEWENK
jgi:UDP-N-acetylmuramoyl-tripeptide--D-alanyl-D-alanine ligase